MKIALRVIQYEFQFLLLLHSYFHFVIFHITFLIISLFNIEFLIIFIIILHYYNIINDLILLIDILFDQLICSNRNFNASERDSYYKYNHCVSLQSPFEFFLLVFNFVSFSFENFNLFHSKMFTDIQYIFSAII